MIHVHPVNDIEKHTLEGTQCKCSPEVMVSTDAEIVVIHNSFDGREGVEWANEILNKSI